MKPVHLASAIIFTVIALLHLWRVAAGAHITIESWAVPMWASYLGILVPAALAFGLWRERG